MRALAGTSARSAGLLFPRIGLIAIPAMRSDLNNNMSVGITYFVHGTTVDNERGISSGWKDAELSELGIRQSRDLRELVKDRKFDAVFCSDLKRAHDTAKMAFGGLAPITPDKRLRECNYGELNGGAESVVGPKKEKSVSTSFPGGECYEDVAYRIQEFLNFLKQEYDGKSVAIVSHEAPQLSLDVLLKGKTWPQAFAENWRKKKSWRPGWEYELK